MRRASATHSCNGTRVHATHLSVVSCTGGREVDRLKMSQRGLYVGKRRVAEQATAVDGTNLVTGLTLPSRLAIRYNGTSFRAIIETVNLTQETDRERRLILRGREA